jgi:hypothetical protein
MAGDCPACGQVLVIPAYKPLQAINPPTPFKSPLEDQKVHSNEKEFEDYAADAICATTEGVAKVTWKAVKIGGPIAAKIAAKVAGRAAKAASESPVGKWWAEPPVKPPTKLEKTGVRLYQILKLFGF